MVVTLKFDKGTAEKLVKWKLIRPNQSKNLTGKELTYQLYDENVVIAFHKDEKNKYMEIADVDGSFGIWIKLTLHRYREIKKILDTFTGP